MASGDDGSAGGSGPATGAAARPALADPVPRGLATAGVVALVAWAAWQRWAMLRATPYASGVDGYFYAVELRGLLEGAGWSYPTAPVGLLWLLPFAAASDPITGLALGSALGSALAAVPAYLVGARLGGGRAPGLMAAAVVATSPSSGYLAGEFVKQGLGLGLALGALAALLAALARPRPGRVALVIGLAAATLLCHRLAFALGVVLAAGPLVARAMALEPRARRRALVGGGALAVVGLGLLAWSTPGGLGLLGDSVRATAAFALPVLDAGGRPLYFGHEVALAAGLGALVIGLGATGRRVAPLALAAGGLALALAIPWLDVGEPQGLAFRLRLVAFVPLALIGAALTRPLIAWLDRGLAGQGGVLVLGLVAALAAARAPRPDAPAIGPDRAMVVAIARVAEVVPAGDVVVTPERHILFMTEWYARRDARLRPGAESPRRRWRLLPSAYLDAPLATVLARARTAPPAGIAPPRALHDGDPLGLVVMPEATWRWALDQLDADDRARYQAWPTY